MVDAAARDRALREGLALLDGRDAAQALFRFRRAHAFDPASADAAAAMGYSLGLMARHREAAICYREALRLDPDHPAALTNLGDLLRSEGRLAEAGQLLERALAAGPALLPQAASNLALVRQAEGREADAELLLQQAVSVAPGFAAAWSNLASVRAGRGDADGAAEAARRAIGEAPAGASGHWNLGLAERMAGRLPSSVASFRRALAISPLDPVLHWNFALSLLAAGQWREGWREWEWRFDAGMARPLPPWPPRWDGKPPLGRTIAVRAEQGLGDTIQFLRYVPLLAAAGASVALEVQRPLEPLLEVNGWLGASARPGEAALQVPLMSLPGLFGTRQGSVPSPRRYLRAGPAGTRWAEWLERLPRPRVGICWRGNPANPADRFRSMPDRIAARIASYAGASFVCLQAGSDPPPGAVRPPERSIADAAAIVANLDLIVAADTMIAHLAGALGRPVWIALSGYADWRWMTRREDSPWYASARLFRQPRLGDWDAVAGAILSALEVHFHGKGRLGEGERTNHLHRAMPLGEPGAEFGGAGGHRPGDGLALRQNGP